MAGIARVACHVLARLQLGLRGAAHCRGRPQRALRSRRHAAELRPLARQRAADGRGAQQWRAQRQLRRLAQPAALPGALALW